MGSRPGGKSALRAGGALAACLVLAVTGCAPSPGAAPAKPAPAGPAPAAAPAAPAALTHVLATPPALSLNQLALFVGADHGTFRQYGLDLEWTIMRSSSAVAATVSAEADYLYSGDSGVFAAAQGMPLKLFLCNAKNQIHRLVAAPTVRDWPDFRGKTVGTTDVASTTTLIADAMLEKHGVGKGEVTYFATGNTENNLTSLLSGQVDAAVLSPPAYVLAEQQGFRIAAKSEEYVPLPPNCAVATETKLREKPDEVKNLIRGTFAAMDVIQRDRDKTLQTMINVLAIEPELAERLYDDVRPQFTSNGKMTEAQIAWQLQEAAERLGSEVPPAKVYDWSLLEQVQAELGRR
jgi:ABC-type nitrate/sulfonate/bicarbonate transport system substrate-binding protein